MDDGIDSEDASYPTMEKEISRVRPIGDPEEEVVSTGKQDDEREHSVSDVPRTVAYVCKNLLPAIEAPRVRLLAMIIHRGQDDVQGEEHEDIQGLTPGRSVA